MVPGQANSLEDVIAAYEEQIAHVEECGSRAVIMASHALCRLARSADDYLLVYDRLLSAVREKSSCTGWAKRSTLGSLGTGEAPT